MEKANPLTVRQALEAMPSKFNPSGWPGLEATIQFNIGGAEPGVYCLRIVNDQCKFQSGPATKPNLSVTAPSDLWLSVMEGRVSGPEVLMKGQYSAQGDFGLLQKWGALFQRGGAEQAQALPAQRPAGPLAGSSPAWMTAAFLPWIIHWITFGSFGLPTMMSVGLPLVLSAAIVVYRLRYNRPGWLEVGGVGFFALGTLLSLLKLPAFAVWGSIWSNLFMGALWLASLATGAEPLCMQYVKWGFDRQLWKLGPFKAINAVITLAWGAQAILAATLGGLGVLGPGLALLFTVLRYLTLVPAYLFTNWYPKAGLRNAAQDADLVLKRLRVMAMVGLGAIIAELIFTLAVGTGYIGGG